MTSEAFGKRKVQSWRLNCERKSRNYTHSSYAPVNGSSPILKHNIFYCQGNACRQGSRVLVYKSWASLSFLPPFFSRTSDSEPLCRLTPFLFSALLAIVRCLEAVPKSHRHILLLASYASGFSHPKSSSSARLPRLIALLTSACINKPCVLIISQIESLYGRIHRHHRLKLIIPCRNSSVRPASRCSEPPRNHAPKLEILRCSTVTVWKR